jgi:hypothetical protein
MDESPAGLEDPVGTEEVDATLIVGTLGPSALDVEIVSRPRFQPFPSARIDACERIPLRGTLRSGGEPPGCAR